MSSSIANKTVAAHRVIGENRPAMLKANLPKGEKREFLAELGGCLDYARRVTGWTVDQLAGELQRDSKQIARWIRGEERTQVDVVFSVPQLRAPFVVALAKMADLAVRTVIEFEERKTA